VVRGLKEFGEPASQGDDYWRTLHRLTDQELTVLTT
jgi:hypothetical protein